MKGLIPFVKFVLHRYHNGTSLSWYCIKHKGIHYWMELLVSQSLLDHAAYIYIPFQMRHYVLELLRIITSPEIFGLKA